MRPCLLQGEVLCKKTTQTQWLHFSLVHEWTSELDYQTHRVRLNSPRPVPEKYQFYKRVCEIDQPIFRYAGDPKPVVQDV